jgi:protein SCO1/2
MRNELARTAACILLASILICQSVLAWAIEDLKNSKIRFDQNMGAELPMNTIFTKETGESTSLKTLVKRKVPTILVFSYYRCPNLCTLILNGLVDALRNLPTERLGLDYQVLTVSIDPLEKPHLALMKKRTYLARYGETRNDSWHFLTGDESNIQHLAQTAGFHYLRDSASGEYSHPSGIIVLTPQGRISQYFFGIQFDPQSLHKALTRAQKSRTGTWVDEVLLYCFHYDPQTSAHGKIILLGIRMTGMIGALALLGFLLYLAVGRKEVRA